MQFNCSKFELIRYGKNSEIKENTVYFTPNHEDVVEEKDDFKFQLDRCLSQKSSRSAQDTQPGTRSNEPVHFQVRRLKNPPFYTMIFNVVVTKL